MDTSSIASWLKDTILGIVTLGIATSILAYLILTFARKIILPFILKMTKNWIRSSFNWLIDPIVHDLVKIYTTSSNLIVQSYFSWQIIKFVISFFAMSWCVDAFVAIIQKSNSLLYRYDLYLTVVLFFLMLIWCIKTIFRVLLPYLVDIDKLIESEVNKRLTAKDK